MKVWCVVYNVESDAWVTQSVHATEDLANAALAKLVKLTYAGQCDVESWDVEE